MKTSITSRRFVSAGFTDTYGCDCFIQESSSVLPRLWLGTCANPMHLDRKMVEALIPLLSYFVNHGQLPPPRKAKTPAKKKATILNATPNISLGRFAKPKRGGIH